MEATAAQPIPAPSQSASSPAPGTAGRTRGRRFEPLQMQQPVKGWKLILAIQRLWRDVGEPGLQLLASVKAVIVPLPDCSPHPRNLVVCQAPRMSWSPRRRDVQETVSASPRLTLLELHQSRFRRGVFRNVHQIRVVPR